MICNINFGNANFSSIPLMRDGDLVLNNFFQLCKVENYSINGRVIRQKNNLLIFIDSVFVWIRPTSSSLGMAHPYNLLSMDKYFLYPISSKKYARYKISGGSKYPELDLMELHMSENNKTLSCFSLDIEHEFLNLDYDLLDFNRLSIVLTFSITSDNKVTNMCLRIKDGMVESKNLNSRLLDIIISMIDINFKSNGIYFDYSEVVHNLQSKYNMTSDLKVRLEKLANSIARYKKSNNGGIPW